jgi:2-keto-4-pentenoate hydratase/2-oxohepta-3-ene-1,7-dioic acid hydratase in catechol pathway
MKLVRYGPPGAERPGLLDAGNTLRDLSGHVADIDPPTLASGLDALKALDPESLAAVEGNPRIGAPVANVGKIICVGLNYADHAAESNMALPKEPVLFMKATTSICGPFDDVVKPMGATKLDWEVELAVVIGKTARSVSEREAIGHVAGYCILNDVSERAFQLEHEGQWVKGKSADTFAPMGPWLATADEIGDPGALDIWLEVNGHRYQGSNTRHLIFSIPFLIAYISRFMTLAPGDVISTGTPPGVGLGLKPPVYLSAGDTMRLGVAGLGEQRQTVVDA